MAIFRQTHSRFLPGSCLWLLPLLSLLGLIAVPLASAQAAAEAAGATSVSSGVSASSARVELPKVIIATPAPSSPHIVASPNSDTVEANRKALEAKAGQDAAKLMLRSTPSEAQVWIDNRPVGKTPLLLIIPPGKYNVELRGYRQETGKKEIALLPKETRDVSVKLELRYPTRVVPSQQ